MACSTLNKLHVQAVLVSCLFSFPGKAYVTIRLRHHVKNIKNGWRGNDVLRHTRTLGAHEKKTNKQKQGDRFCPITGARKVTPTVQYFFQPFFLVFIFDECVRCASDITPYPYSSLRERTVLGRKTHRFLPSPHPLRTYLQGTSLPSCSCFASYLSRSLQFALRKINREL